MTSPAARLRLFGAPILSDADGTPVAGGAAEPHRIALLALLALHPKRTATRAELTAHLWPGHDPKEATQLLNQALFSINKSLGDDAIFSNAKEIRLGSRVTVDALDFQAALDEGRPGDAIDLYTGPLLEGFVLDDALEFQGWAANERARFAAARKELRPIAETAVEVQHDVAKRSPKVVREVDSALPDLRRKRPKRPKTPPEVVRPVEEPPAEVVRAVEESPPEELDAPPEPTPEVPAAAQESPPEVPPPSPQPPSEVFWAQEPSPVVGHASQQTTPREPRTSAENREEIARAEQTPAPDFVIERTAPPPDVAPPTAPPPPPPPPPPTSRVEFTPEFDGPPAAHFERDAGNLPVVYEPPRAEVPAADVVPDAEPVVFIEPPEAPPAPEASAPEPVLPEPPRPARRRRPIPLPSARLVVTVLVLALIGVGAYVARGRIVDAGAKARSIAGDASARARSIATGIVDARDRPRAIAVLPIEYTGSDPQTQALAAGISEQLRRMLAQAGLLVTPGDMFAYRTPPYDIRALAETLGVAHVLQGAIQKDDTVRFRFQLVNADGATRWEQDYAPNLADILVLHDDVVETVARQILERPPTRSGRRDTQNGAAYQLVLRANERALVRSDSAARQALELFRQAVALDSSYARAWAGLARTYVRTAASLPAAGRDRQLVLANQAAQRALTIDDSLPEAHAALGLVRSARLDMARADTSLQRALELDPTRATRESLVDLYLITGRHDQALALAEEALERDPRSPYAHADVARVLQFMNRCEPALAHLDSAATANRPLARAAATRALCHAQMGRSNDAIAAARSAITPRDSSSVSLLAHLLLRAGNSAEAAPLRAAVSNRMRRGLASSVDLALLDAGDKNFAAAARRAQEAVDARSFIMAPGAEFALLTAPLFQELHRQPGFLEARKRLGFR